MSPKHPAASNEDKARSADFHLLCQAVRGAGKLALSYFEKPLDIQIKSDGTEVSEADLVVDAYLKDALMTQRPGYGWLSEESEDDPARHDALRLWVADPIDGTRAYLRKKPEWVVSVALLVNNKPDMGCLYCPVKDEFFAALKGGGARLNGAQITATSRGSIKGSKIAAKDQLFNRPIWSAPWPEVDIFWANSIAYRIALVAAGRADATLSMSGKSDWDLAAADILLSEAGGRVTDHLGQPYRYNLPDPRHKSVIAAGRALHPLLIERTKTVDSTSLSR